MKREDVKNKIPGITEEQLNTRKGKIPGINGEVDMSVAYKDYASITQRAGLTQIRG